MLRSKAPPPAAIAAPPPKGENHKNQKQLLLNLSPPLEGQTDRAGGGALAIQREFQFYRRSTIKRFVQDYATVTTFHNAFYRGKSYSC